MLDVLRWYLALVLIGAGGLLPAALLFGTLRSGGVLYARPLALLLVAQATWLVSALVRVPYGDGLVFATVAALWAGSAAIAWRRPELLGGLRDRWRVLLAGEAVFLVLLAGIAALRAQAPDAFGTEKPMDLMLLNSVHEAPRMPPEDAWFANRSLSYYHLGHVQVDVIARFAGVPVGVAFNLGVATAGALVGAGVFALAGDMLSITRVRRASSVWVAGAVALIGLLLLAPLEGLVDIVTANGVGRGPAERLGVVGLPGPADTEWGVPTEFWWWWRATRILPMAITEFPAFSLLLGDLHAHVLALPTGVLALAVALVAFEGRAALTWRVWLRNPPALLMVGAVFAGLVMTNAWDVVLYGAIFFAAAAVAFAGTGWGPLGATLLAGRYLVLPGVVAVLIAAPFLTSLEASAREVDFVQEDVSDPVRLGLLWLPLVLPFVVAALFVRTRVPRRALAWAGGVAAFAVLLWTAGVVSRGGLGALSERGSGWVTLALLVAAVGWTAPAALVAYRDADRARAAWLGLAAAGATIILVTELVYLVDPFGRRTNTVFKFWYVVWVLFAVGAGVALANWYDRLRGWRPSPVAAVALGVAGALYAGSLLWTPAAAISRVREPQQTALSATAFYGRFDPELADAQRWVREQLDSDALVLEAVGAQYSYTNQLSATTGVPTLLGWAGHEVQWRGQTTELTDRFSAVAEIYSLGPSDRTLELIARYGITHIYLGREEVRQFGPEVMQRFAAWQTVFETPATRIVVVPPTRPEGAR